MRPHALLALCVALLVAAGAVTPAVAPASVAPASASSATTADATSSAPADSRDASSIGNNTTQSPVSGLSLFTVTDPSPPPLKVGFSVVNDNEFAFAAYVDGEFVGGTEFTSLSGGSAVDGYEVPVEAYVTGEHRVTVYAVQDSNDNGVADATDEPYRRNGTTVKTTGTYTFDAGGGVTSLAFYTDYDEDPRPIRVGYTVEPNTTVAFALVADGELVGHTEYRHYDSKLHKDGLEVPLERNLTGEVELTIVALRDTNGNGEVDVGDEPYRDDGQRVASTLTFDFGGVTTDSESSTTPDGGTERSTDESSGVPGFGLGAGLAGLIGAGLVAWRQ